jgi:hypothetical protein
MGKTARRVLMVSALGGALVGVGLGANPSPALASCDPSYPDFCIPPVWEVGDLDCADIGAGWFTVYQPDPHHLDGDYDGYGCEWN